MGKLSTMGSPQSRFSSLLATASDFINIVVQVTPVMFTGLVAAWAYFQEIPGLPIFIISLFVFMTTIWIVVGLRFLKRGTGKIPLSELAWGLGIEQMQMMHVPDGDDEWISRVSFRNYSEYPLRLFVNRVDLKVESVSPEMTPPPSMGVIIRANVPMGVNVMRVKRRVLSLRPRLEGRIMFDLLYGHPDTGYTRHVIREYDIEGPVVSQSPGLAVCFFCAKAYPRRR